MSKKYELLMEDCITLADETKLYRIKSLKDFSDVKKGDIGGYIESEANLSQKRDCWVYDDARVYGNALVCDYAKIYGNAKIYDNAEVYGNAEVYNYSHVFKYARVRNNAKIYGNAKIYDTAEVYGEAKIYGLAEIYDNAKVSGNAEVYGCAEVHNDSIVCEHDKIYNKEEEDTMKKNKYTEDLLNKNVDYRTSYETKENTNKTYITDEKAFVSENNTTHKLALKHIADNFCVTGRGEPRSYFTYHGWRDGKLDLEAGDYKEGGFHKREQFSESDLEYIALQKINELWDDERHAFEKNKKKVARREWFASTGLDTAKHFVKVFAKAFAVGCTIGGASNIIFAIIAKIKNRRNR